MSIQSSSFWLSQKHLLEESLASERSQLNEISVPLSQKTKSLEAKKAYLRAIDPKLVSEARSQSQNKISQIASHIFFSLKSFFYSLFCGLKGDLKAYKIEKLQMKDLIEKRGSIESKISSISQELLQVNKSHKVALESEKALEKKFL